ncbi:MAG TPA: amidohydrolase [Pasteurellaceae bacterium]|nr:amidohydrolase [Pasteurellaceae bacterium]
MKLICIEEHIQSPALARASMSAMLQQAPYLADWGKDVTDQADNIDRPRVIAAEQSLAKLVDIDGNRLKEMNAQGIDMQILSYAGMPHLIDGQNSLDLIKQANDQLAQKVKQHPNRFAGFAILPWRDVEASLVELERCVNQLDLKAVLISGRPSEDFLDHERYLPVLAKLNELQVPLFLHPGFPYPQVQQAYYRGFNREVSARLSMFGWGWHNEAGIQLIRMILAGIFDKFPDLNVISGHWGELVPYYLQRLDDSIPQQATGLKRTIAQTLRDQVYVTPSGMLSLPHFEFIRSVVGTDRILYSIDYPYLSLNGAREWIECLPISREEKEKIAFRNAVRLFKLKFE